jgi:hypothetical protein
MHHSFVPLLLLLLLPLAYLAHRLGLLRHLAIRLILASCGVGILVAAAREGEVDFVYLDRLKFALAGAAALLIYLRHSGLAGRRIFLIGLTIVSSLAWVVYLNFFSFHGARTFLHNHDIAHYYLGSKYFPELGYTGLYTALLRAEGEMYQNRFVSPLVRDLETSELVPIEVLLSNSDPVKARFSPERWAEFCKDMVYFHEATGPQYAEILKDHGFNPSPLWAFVGGWLANRVPAGSHAGIVALACLDPVLVAGLFLAVAWAFGLEMLLLSMIYFCVFFGSSFGWVGGAFLRYMWLFGVVVGLCCLHRGRPAAAGVLFGCATTLRLFPVAFVLALGCKAVSAGRLERRHLRFFAASAVTVLLLLGVTLPWQRGWQHWVEFQQRTHNRLQKMSTNLCGLTQILAYGGPEPTTTAAERDGYWLRHWRVYRLQVYGLLPLALALVLWRSRREDDVGAAAMGSLLVFVGLNLAAYYYILLLAAMFAFRRQRPLLVTFFACEAVMDFLQLFEDRPEALFFYRNVLIACLLVDLYLMPRPFEPHDGKSERANAPERAPAG